MLGLLKRVLHRLVQLLWVLMVVALVYGLWARDMVPKSWHAICDPTAFVVICLFTVSVGVWVFWHHFRFRDITMAHVDAMDGLEFENFCAFLLKRNGYTRIQQTKGSGDQGVDVIATKKGIKFGVQCKRYNGFVGNHAVQEVWSGKEYYQLDQAVVLTNSTFSDAANDLATQLGVTLIDREGLRKLMKRLPS